MSSSEVVSGKVARRSGPRVNRRALEYECWRKGLSYQDISDGTGIAVSTLVAIGQGTPTSRDTFRRLAKFLSEQPVVQGADALLVPPQTEAAE